MREEGIWTHHLTRLHHHEIGGVTLTFLPLSECHSISTCHTLLINVA